MRDEFAAGRVFWWALATTLVVGAGTWMWLHGDYYFASPAEQALHPEHPVVRSSGTIGLRLGIAGTACFVANLLYLVRRRLLWMARLGSLRKWLGFHALSGLTGGALILLHSAFSIRSTIGGIAFFALLVVVVTGVIGRYIHALIPRTLEGSAKRFEQVSAEVKQHTERLRERGVAVEFEAAPLPRLPDNVVGALRGLIAGRVAIRRDRRELLALFAGKSGDRPEELDALVQRLLKSRRQLRQYHQLRRLMASWRFLHRWLALIALRYLPKAWGSE
jgi:hypothetical protein